MARTKQTARKSTGGKAPRRLLAASSKAQFRAMITARQQVSHSPAVGDKDKSSRTSYLNYENMFYSYTFPTGPTVSEPFVPRVTTAISKNPVTNETEHWLGMSFNSMYDGKGIQTYGRPDINLIVVLDISGSMMTRFDESSAGSKLDVAKECLRGIIQQLRKGDSLGLVVFNGEAMVEMELTHFERINKKKLHRKIDALKAHGVTNLSAAANAGSGLLINMREGVNVTSRMLFLTDLNSTVDSENDERMLMKILQGNARQGLYTSVVGIGMDLNVKLVEQISSTTGARYISVDSPDEFKRVVNTEFGYDITVIAFDIKISLKSKFFEIEKGYGSPEVNNLKRGKPILLSSEFPCWQDASGQSKGGLLIFKLKPKKALAKAVAAKDIEVDISWNDVMGCAHSVTRKKKIQPGHEDNGIRKAIAIIHYIDLHNDYVLDQGQHRARFLELFLGFREFFVEEIKSTGDLTLGSTNMGDLEMLDKIIELESKPNDKPDGPLHSSVLPSRRAHRRAGVQGVKFKIPSAAVRSPPPKAGGTSPKQIRLIPAQRQTAAKLSPKKIASSSMPKVSSASLPARPASKLRARPQSTQTKSQKENVAVSKTITSSKQKNRSMQKAVVRAGRRGRGPAQRPKPAATRATKAVTKPQKAIASTTAKSPVAHTKSSRSAQNRSSSRAATKRTRHSSRSAPPRAVLQPRPRKRAASDRSVSAPASKRMRKS